MEKLSLPILIIDKLGFLGNALSERLLPDSQIVLVSGFENIKNKVKFDNLSHLLYQRTKNKIPLIPDYQYSSILIVWNGEKEILESMAQFVEKARNDKARLILAFSLFSAKYALVEKIREFYPQIKIIIVGDLFPLSIQSPVNEILYQAKVGNRIKLLGDGLRKIYPIFLEDAVDKIMTIILDEKSNKGRIINLLPRQPTTELSLARSLQKINPMITVDFIGGYVLDDGFEFFNDAEYPLEDHCLSKNKLERALGDFRPTLFCQKHKEKKRQGSLWKNSFWATCLLIFLAIIFPFLATFFSSFLGTNFLMRTKKEAANGNFLLASKNARLSQTFFEFADLSSRPIVLGLTYFNQDGLTTNFVSYIKVAKETSLAIDYSLNGFLNLKKVLEGKAQNPKEDFSNALNNFKKAKIALQESQLKKPAFFKDESFLTKLKDLDSSTQFFSSTADVLPIIFGFSSEKKYLILFQNNMELRPGGGFIGSYGLLTLAQGRVTRFSIHDVYEADGQLKGHLEPPFAIRRHLPSVHLYLRDSNFSSDFPKNASSAAFLLKQETNEMVDGLIAVDVTFVRGLLKILGPLKVADYNETVTADNLYLLTQSHAEKDFFPGSNQKKDFLRSLFKTMQNNFSTNNKISYFELLKVMTDSISQKHLLFAFADPSIQNVFTVNRMSSSLWDDRENADNLINDFIGVNEANLGVNKANYFLKRKIEQTVKVDREGSVFGQVKISYKNTSLKKQWPGGDYKNYLRVILPFGANLTEIKIDGVSQKTTPAITDFTVYEAKNFVPPKELEVEKTIEDGKTVYGFLVLVPAEALRTVVISYELAQKILPGSENFSYSLIVFKQPGTEEDSFSLALSYPEEFKLTKLTDGGKKEEGKITYSKKLDKDLFFELSFSRR